MTDSLTVTEVEDIATIGYNEVVGEPQPESMVTTTEVPITKLHIPNDDARMFKRSIMAMLSNGVNLLPVCRACYDAQRPSQCQWGKLESTGELVLQCECTTRVLDGVRR